MKMTRPRVAVYHDEDRVDRDKRQRLHDTYKLKTGDAVAQHRLNFRRYTVIRLGPYIYIRFTKTLEIS